MKRVFALLLTVMMLLALTACNEKTKPQKDISKKFIKIADNYVAIVFGGNTDLLEEMAPDEFWDFDSDYVRPAGYEGVMSGYSAMGFYEWYAGQVTKEVGQVYGELEVSYKISNYSDLSENKLDNIIDALEDDYDIDPEDVEGGWSVTISYEIDGSNNSRSGKLKVTAVCIDGEYYWVEYDSSNKLPVRFPICERLF